MTENKYAKQERQEAVAYESATAIAQNVRKVQIRFFPKGDLFSKLDPAYKSFRDLEINQEN